MAGIWYKSKIEIKERPHSSSGITSFSCLFSDIWDQRWERWMRSLSVSICFWILILISLSHRHNLRSEMFLWSWWWQEQQWMRAGIWWLSILNMSSTLTHSSGSNIRDWTTWSLWSQSQNIFLSVKHESYTRSTHKHQVQIKYYDFESLGHEKRSWFILHSLQATTEISHLPAKYS